LAALEERSATTNHKNRKADGGLAAKAIGPATVWWMRQDGVLRADADDPLGFRDMASTSGKGVHRHCQWAKRPTGWPEPMSGVTVLGKASCCRFDD